jgi:aryl sulfotransferase
MPTFCDRLANTDIEALEAIRSACHRLLPNWQSPERYFIQRSEISGALTKLIRLTGSEPRWLNATAAACGATASPGNGASQGVSIPTTLLPANAAPDERTGDIALRHYPVRLSQGVAHQIALFRTPPNMPSCLANSKIEGCHQRGDVMPELVRAASRAVRSRFLDSTRWQGYSPRPDDIIIGTYSKCGTTWVQRIVSMLVFKSPAPRPIVDESPWPDRRTGDLETILERIKAQAHRRYLKTHLPFDALPVYEGVKFIHVGRDGRDAAMSFHNHLTHFSVEAIRRLNEVSRGDQKFGDDWLPVPESAARFFAEWIDDDGGAMGDEGTSFFNVENAYWAARNEPNMLLVHYNDLKADRDSEMRRIADFLNIDIPATLWPEIVAAAGFDAMKAQGETLLPNADRTFIGGAARFLHKGTNGRWQGIVSSADLARYDAMLETHFTPALADWVSNGRAGR